MRFDYVLTRGVQCVQGSIHILSEVSGTDNVGDHLPLSGRFAIDLKNGSWNPKRKQLDYDVKKFDTPENRLEEGIGKMPCIPVHVDNTSHRHMLDTNVHELLCRCFPKDKVTKKQSYTFDISLDLLKVTAEARKAFFRAWSVVQVDRPIVRAVSALWANCPWRAKWSHVCGFSCDSNLRKFVQLRSQLRLAQKRSSTSVKQDKQKWHRDTIDSIVDSFDKGGMRTMYSSIKHVLNINKIRNSTKQVLRVCDEDGNVSQSLHQENCV